MQDDDPRFARMSGVTCDVNESAADATSTGNAGVGESSSSRLCSPASRPPPLPTPPPLPPNAASLPDGEAKTASDGAVPPIQYGSGPPLQRCELPLSEQDETLIQRWQEHASPTYRLRVAARETPCWLVSLVLHAMVMVILGSLAASRTENKRWSPIVIRLASYEQDRGLELQPLSLLQADNQPPEGEMEASATAGTVSFLDQLQEIEDEVSSWLEESEQYVAEIGDVAEEALEEPDAEAVADVASFEAITHRHVPTQVGRPQPSGATDQRGFDGIVEQFIQYDIGRLPGARGEKARREFAALGPEAIPALVRGLNRAARISASCPIGVISSKLNAQLGSTSDPELLRYALDNAGRGVSERAPHGGRIQQLVRRWRERFGRSPEDFAMRNAQEVAIREAKAASSLLRMAKSLQAAGKDDSAIRRYLAIVKRYPNTRAARAAQSELAAIRKKRNSWFAGVRPR